MSSTAIINARLVLEHQVVHGGALLAVNGKIAAYGRRGDITIPPGCEILDAQNCYAGPGFVDIHNHGGGGYWFYQNPEAAAAFFLKHGTTSVLPTFFYTMSLSEVLDGLDKIRALMCQPDCTIKGVNFEGPYLNPNYGCSRDQVWDIRRKEYEQMIEKGAGVIKIWCVSPEREGIMDFVKAASAISPVFSVAHSEATADELYAIIPYGLKLATHHLNATGITGGYGFGTRNFGLDDAVQLHDGIFIELIADSGAVHVSERFLQLAYKIKGADRIALITDSTEFGDAPPANDIRFDSSGDLAGSALTMEKAMRNMMAHTGVGICEGFRMAATTPAKILGLGDKLGRIATGLAADIVIVDDDLNVKNVLLNGKAQEVQPF